jgi:hypothetical protein
MAIFQAALLNSVLISSFVWTAWLPPPFRTALWCLCVSFWILGWVDAHRAASRQRAAAQLDPQLDLFLAARGEYLRGAWTRAAETLTQLLRADPRDVEARLMLATLTRHDGRCEEAREHLRKLQRLERAGQWNMEIQREWQQLTWQSVVNESGPADDVGTEASDDALPKAA